MIPWDVYIPPHDRYFGSANDYRDLFQFFQNNAPLISGYRPTPKLGIGFSIGQTDVSLFRSSVYKCLRNGAAFKIVHCGGEILQREVLRSALSGLQGVLDPTPKGSLSGTNLRILRGAGLPVSFGNSRQVDINAPVLVGAASPWCAIRRVAPNGKVALFIVPLTFGIPGPGSAARLSVSRKDLQFSSGVRLLAPGRNELLSVNNVDDQRAEIELPNIDEVTVVVT